jgi:outer membrane receptor protein involved in Fe transport
VKSALPDYNLSFDADVFDIEWRDIQLLEFVDNFNVNANGGRANSKGVEANLTWQPIERLTLNLNGAYTAATLSNDASAVGAVAGNGLPYAPLWTGTLNGDYEFAPINDLTPYVGASVHYTGIRGGGFATSPFTGLAVPQLTLPDYATFDFRVGVSMDKWSVEIYGKNVNDSKGISAFSSFGGSQVSGAAATASIIEPRIFGIVLRGKI